MTKKNELATLAPYAEVFARSDYFKLRPHDKGGIEQGLTIMLAGAAMGLTPFQAMQSVHIIEGRPSLAANAYAAHLRQHPVYDYVVIELSMSACEIEFTRQGKPIGRTRITLAEAERLGWTVGGKGPKVNWVKHPDAMLFARCVSRGARYYCPDLFGFSVYTPDELESEFVEAEVVSTSTVGAPEAQRADSQRGPEPRDLSMDAEWESILRGEADEPHPEEPDQSEGQS